MVKTIMCMANSEILMVFIRWFAPAIQQEIPPTVGSPTGSLTLYRFQKINAFSGIRMPNRTSIFQDRADNIFVSNRFN